MPYLNSYDKRENFYIGLMRSRELAKYFVTRIYGTIINKVEDKHNAKSVLCSPENRLLTKTSKILRTVC